VTDSGRLLELEQRLDRTERELGRLQDIQAVRTLHFKYGYYMDKCLFSEIVDLFSDDCEIHFLGGLFLGKAGARRLYGRASGLNGPADGLLFEHLQVQDIVDVAGDGMSARGRFRCLMLGAVHESRTDAPPSIPEQFWEGGVYENIFIKDRGTWKIKVFNYNVVWQADYDKGPAHSGAASMMVSPYTRTYPDDPRGPDRIVAPAPPRWPRSTVVPFHYPHPVTGEEWRPAAGD